MRAFDRSKIALFATHLAFNGPDGRVPLGRSPWNFARKSEDGQGTQQ